MTNASVSVNARSVDRPLGLPDDAFAQKRPHRGLITKAEVRAVSLYKLGLRRNSIVWDVGAGVARLGLRRHSSHRREWYTRWSAMQSVSICCA